MCRNCWVEEDSPRDWTPTTARVVELIRELYAVEPVGGPLHVELDDWNIDGSVIAPDYSMGEYDERARELCDEIGRLLTAMTVRERYAALAYREGYIEPPVTS